MLRYNLSIYFFTNIKNGYTIIIPFVTSLCCMSICIQRRPEGSAMICCNVHIHPCICHRRISYMNPDLKTILTLPQIACEHFYSLTVQWRGRRKKLAFRFYQILFLVKNTIMNTREFNKVLITKDRLNELIKWINSKNLQTSEVAEEKFKCRTYRLDKKPAVKLYHYKSWTYYFHDFLEKVNYQYIPA